jgi:hypothetical protein
MRLGAVSHEFITGEPVRFAFPSRSTTNSLFDRCQNTNLTRLVNLLSTSANHLLRAAMPQPKKLLEIFKPGNFVSVEGRVCSFSAADVAATVAAYDPAKHKAPLVVGHPKIEDPAYGHAVALSLGSKNVILAEPANVDPAFADAVNNERYDSISASFWSPENPRNPVPGVWYLRHIGFLGAVPPAVPGLNQPSFAEGDDTDLITINFAAPQEPIMEPKEKAALEERERKLQTDEASFADQQAGLAAREKALKEKEAKVRTDEIESFAEGLIAQGRLLPGEKASLVAVLQSIPEGVTVSFADGDGKAADTDPAELLRKFVSGLPPRVDFAERSGREDEDGNESASTSFAAPAGYTVDPKQMEKHKKIEDYAKKNNVPYAEAAAAVG